MHRTLALISAANSYSNLKWLSLLTSILMLFLTFFILLNYNSNRWFKYDAISLIDQISRGNATNGFEDKIEEGSIGLWYLCVRRHMDVKARCELFTNLTRPDYVYSLLILDSFALFLANFTILPCWILFMLLAYNINNIFNRYITYLIWIQTLLTLILTCCLVSALAIVRSSKFHDPGKFYDYKYPPRYLVFSSASGMHLLITATILSIITFVLSLLTLAGKIYIDFEVAEAEQELIKQLSDEYAPMTWQRPTIVESASSSLDNDHDQPPSYESSTGRRNR